MCENTNRSTKEEEKLKIFKGIFQDDMNLNTYYDYKHKVIKFNSKILKVKLSSKKIFSVCVGSCRPKLKFLSISEF